MMLLKRDNGIDAQRQQGKNENEGNGHFPQNVVVYSHGLTKIVRRPFSRPFTAIQDDLNAAMSQSIQGLRMCVRGG